MAEIQIETSQNVPIFFKAAEVEKRVIAFLIDNVIKKAYISVVGYIFYLILKNEKDSIFTIIDNLDYWGFISLIIVLFLPVIFYSLVMEVIFSGQTFGKKVLKIKVVKIDGFQASFIDYFIRWVMRIIDISFVPFLPGLVAFLFSFNTKKLQRLGGIASGTAVIDLKNKATIDHTILQEINSNYKPTYTSVIKLSDNDMRIIKQAYEGAVKNSNHDTLLRIKNKIIEVIGVEPLKNQTASQFIDCIIKDFNFYTGK